MKHARQAVGRRNKVKREAKSSDINETRANSFSSRILGAHLYKERPICRCLRFFLEFEQNNYEKSEPKSEAIKGQDPW